MKHRFNMVQKKRAFGLLFILPWFIGFLLFFLLPVLQTMWFSFHNVEMTATGYELIPAGIENYKKAFLSDAEFPLKLGNSLLVLLPDVFMVLVFSYLMSVIIHQNFRGSGVIKMIFFLTVVLSSGAFITLQSQNGSVNTDQLNHVIAENSTAAGLLDKLQIEQYLLELGVTETMINYLITPMQRLFSILMKSGVQIFIFLAALKSIPSSLYEACHMEGATAWEAFWKITFPMLSPMLLVNVVYTVVDSFMASDNECMVYVRDTVFSGAGATRQEFGYGSALAWIYFAVIAVILAVSMGVISKGVVYND